MPDWNSKLSYSTLKVVTVKDWKLGLLHYTFQIAILGYVVGYAVLVEQGFMRKEQIIGGSINVNARAPSEASSDQFCCDDASDASDASCPNANSQRRLPCLDWAEGMAEYPAPTNVELVLTSR
eukprot:gene28535-35455_t